MTAQLVFTVIRILPAIMLAGSVMVLATPSDTTLPEPPLGFVWQRMPELKAAFLAPKGWHVKKRQTDGTDAMFITLEDIEVEGMFRTGFSMNAVPQISVKTKMWAKQYARMFHETIKNDSSVTVRSEWENPQGPFMVYGLQFTKNVSNSDSIVVHQLVIANEKTDRMYLIMFESPADLWDAAWRIGDVIMNRFILDESI